MNNPEREPITTEPRANDPEGIRLRRQANVRRASQENRELCPPGMEDLLGTSTIVVHQTLEWLEIFTGYDTNNRYDVLNSEGQRMYLAAEQSDALSRLCLGSRRPFKIAILDPSYPTFLDPSNPRNTAEACCLKINRIMTWPFFFSCGLCFGRTQVLTRDDRLLGEISQDCSHCCYPGLTVLDEEGNETLKIEGPCSCCLCCSVHFRIKDMEGNEIGEIHKRWAGLIQEVFTTADIFGVSFPADLNPRLKCLLLGAVFMIDFMFFEHNDDQDRRRRHRHWD